LKRLTKLAHSADNTSHFSRYRGIIEAMAREAWTDERLDDLKSTVDDGFRDMRTEFRALRTEMKDESNALRAEFKAESLATRAEIGAVNRSIHQLTVGLIGAMLVGFLGTIATILTQV
jgi:hypothetical protein